MKMCGHCDHFSEPGKVRAKCDRLGWMVKADNPAITCPKEGFVCTDEHPPEVATASPKANGPALLAHTCYLCDPPKTLANAQGLGVHRDRAHGIRAGEDAPAGGGVVRSPESAPEPAPPLDVPCDGPGLTLGQVREAQSRMPDMPRPDMVVDLPDQSPPEWATVAPEDFNADEPTLGRECAECAAPVKPPKTRVLRVDVSATINRRILRALVDTRIELLRRELRDCTTWADIDSLITCEVPRIVELAEIGGPQG